MKIYVIKRDGRKVLFKKDLILNAITAAGKEIYTDDEKSLNRFLFVANYMTDDIVLSIKRKLAEKDDNSIDVEAIQDIVENELLESDYPKVAQAYIRYRQKRTDERQSPTDKVIKEIVSGSSEYWNTENSNKNAKLVTTQRDYIAGAVSTDHARRFLFPKECVEAHDAGIIHLHDMDYAIQQMNNCGLVNLEDMLQYGTVISNVKIDKPHRFSTACNIATQIIATVASNQYGGQSITLAHLSPFIQSTRDNLKREFPDLTENQLDRLVKRDISAGIQTLQYQIVTLMTTNGQAPFITVFANLAEVPEGKEREDLALVIEELLKQRIKGVKNSAGVYVAPAFPKIVYGLDECNVYEGSKYFYLTKLAAKCTAYRMVPDYQSNKIQRSLKNGDIFPSMGALTETSLVDIRIKDNVYENIPIKKAYGLINQCLRSYHQFGHDIAKKDKVCGVYRLVHVPTGLFYIGSSTDIYRRFREHKYSYLNKGTLGDNYFVGDYNISNLQFDILETCDIDDMYSLESKYYKQMKSDLCVNFKDPKDRGNYRKGTDDSVKSMNGIPYNSFNDKWNGTMVKEIPSYAGIYIKSGYQWVPIRYMQYNNEKCPLQLYRVSYCINGKLHSIAGTQDHPLETNRGRVYLEDLTVDDTLKDIDGNDVVISNIKKIDSKHRTYDFTTDNDMFNVNGIVSHNCRSMLPVDRTKKNYARVLNYEKYKGHKYYGKFNKGVVTINLPDVALSAHKDMELFWKIFKERLELCHKALRCRYEHLVGTKSDVAPILWQNGAYARLDKGETIDELLKHGYSSISLGYAGLYECVYYMTGKSHTSKEGRDFALKIMKYMEDCCTNWDAKEDIGYSLYGSPIEATTYTFAKALRKRFGVVEGVTDHDYITNSYHVNVREPIDAFTKLKIEADFQKHSLGGCISYVEVPDLKGNVDVVLKLMQFIYENIMYAELNCKIDYCQKCGYSGEIKIKGEPGHLYWECPNCGNTDQSTMEVTRRTCGYLGTNFWNQGRTEEIRDRKLHLDTKERL